jgi:hypothetical protein
LIIGCFLLPSTLYFCSGVHKDQIIFAGLSFFCYALYKLLFQSGKIRHYLMLCFATLLIFLFRNYILLALLPAVFSLLLARQLRKNTLFVFSTTYSCLLILLFFLPIDFHLHPFRLILERQAEFKTLPIAHSQIQTPAISSNPISFIKAIPTAFLNTLVRPFFWEIHSFIGFMASLLQFSLFCIYMIGFYKAIRLKIPPRPFPLFLCCFGMTLFLLVGLIVPNYLTIIRYESVLLPLTLIPFLISVFDRRDT